MPDVRLVHTSALGADVLAAVHGLLVAVFADELSEEDWEHGLGGMHAVAWEDGAVVAHASVVQRRLLHGGRALRAGYVEAVAVHPERRRRGLGAAVMAALEPVLRGAYDIGALGATDAAIALYESLGWRPWRGPLSALTPDGIVPTPDEAGGVLVLELGVPLDLDGELTCDWRDGDVW
jgi:aminoglycoside 2'-N-acetyltransferase I